MLLCNWGAIHPATWIAGRRAPASTNSLDPGQGAMGLVTGTAVATIHYSSLSCVCLSPLLGSCFLPSLGFSVGGFWASGPSHGEKAHLTKATSEENVSMVMG